MTRVSPALLALLMTLIGHAIFFPVMAGMSFWVDGWFPPVMIDFRNTWFGGRSWWDGDLTVFTDSVPYNMARWYWFPLEPGHIWSYPLHFLVICIPFGLLS